MKPGSASKIVRSFIITILAMSSIVASNTGHTQIRLTDVVTFGADSSGGILYQPDVWETRPNGNFNNWVQSLPGGNFLNGPSDSQAQPNVALTPGTNSFRIYGSPGIDNPNFGINLFFNGAATPAISAFGPMLTNIAQVHSFGPDSASPTPQTVPVYNAGIPGAGRLSFASSNLLITLTDFYLARPAVFNLDMGGETSLGADGVLDYVGGFTLVVTTNTSNSTPSLDGLVAWWRGEGNAQDTVSGNNGDLHGNVTYVAGEVGQAFDFNNGFVSVPANSSLNVGTGSGFTFEAWVNPKTLSPQTIAEWNDNAGHAGVSLSISEGATGSGPAGCLYANLLDNTGHTHFISTGAGVVSTNEFQHIALTYDKSSGIAVLYVNGMPAASALLGTFIPQTSYYFYFGATPSGSLATNYFSGYIDEPSVYSRALSDSEITAIYNAGSSGKHIPTPPVSSSQPLLNIDFGSGSARGYSLKTGFAAIGQTTNDFWNFYDRDASSTSGDWRTSGALTNLQLADGSVTSVGMTVSDAPGAWDDSSSDPMYKTYDYPLDHGTNVITFTNLPAGQYDVLAYSPDGNFEVSVGNTSYGVKTTRDDPVSSVPTWTEGVQYARFTNVTVVAGQPLVLKVRNGVGNYAIISGVQIVQVGSETTSTNACTPVPAGLVDWWAGESNVVDQVGTNDGTGIGAVTYGPGKVGSAFHFSGVNSYVQIPHSPSLNFSNALTIELWFKNEGAPTGYGLVAKRGTTVGPCNFGINITSSGIGAYYNDPTVFNAGDDGLSYEVCRTPVVPTTNVFHHLAATWYQTESNMVEMQVYLDGQLLRARSISGNLTATLNTDVITIGSSTVNSEFFKGVIDEVSFYNRVLSPEEIAAIYNAGNAGKCPNQELYVVPPKYSNVEAPGSSGVLNDTTIRLQEVYASSLFTNGPIKINKIWLRPNVTDGTVGTAFDTTISNLQVRLSTTAQNPNSLSSSFAANTGSDEVIAFSGAIHLSSANVGPNSGPKNLDICIPLATPFYYDPSKGNLLVEFRKFSPERTTIVDECTSVSDGVSRVFTSNPNGTTGFSDNGADVLGFSVERENTTSMPPSIIQQPASQTVIMGNTVTFKVAVQGVAPLSYQWRRNGTNVAGCNSAQLVLTNVCRSQIGTYSVLAANSSGGVISSNATLQVRVPQVLSEPRLQPDGSLQMTSHDADGGPISTNELANFEVQVSSNLMNWSTLPDGLILTNGHLQVLDRARTNYPARFYRVIEH